MTIPIRVKLLTKTAKAPEQANEGDLLDLFADGFCVQNLEDCFSKEIIDGEFDNCYVGGSVEEYCDISNVEDEFLQNQLKDIIVTKTKASVYNNYDGSVVLYPQGRILVKTGISLELPVQLNYGWSFKSDDVYLGEGSHSILAYAVADLRPRSGLALKHGITVLNAPATIDNSYRKEIGVILINHGHEPYTIRKGDKIAQMLIRPLYPNKMEIVENIEDSSRGGYGSTGK